MSERPRKKRTRKANSTDVRGLQTRKEQLGVQAETKSMPQLKSEAVAETDTTKTEGGYKMNYMSIGDRIREHKSTIIQIAAMVAIAVIVSAIMIPALAPSKGIYTRDINRIAANVTTIQSNVISIKGNIDAILALGQLATKAQLDAVSTEVAWHNDDIAALQERMNSAESTIATVEADMAEIVASPPEGYLTGDFSNYTLHAKADTAGNFTANVNLVYLIPIVVGNTTLEDALHTFYGSINWTGVVPNYVCAITYSGNTTTWGISKVSWNIGTFEMVVTNETLVDIIPTGLNTTYAPDFAYVEVWPVLRWYRSVLGYEGE